MPYINRQQSVPSQSLLGETSLSHRSSSHRDKQVRWLKVVPCLVCLFIMVALSSWQSGCAAAADEIVVLSMTQEPADIEFIVPIRIASPPRPVATLIRTSPAIKLPSDQSHGTWDFYLDNTWSILGGDVAQTLASTVLDLQPQGTVQLHIEAYCDDRDTSAYSLVIGDRWLSKVESYLVSLGASPSTLSARSFGKERLLCHDVTGQCWEANLRLRESFRLMAIDQSEQGCLIRVNHTGDQPRVDDKGNLNRRPRLQRLHVSLPTRISSQ